MALVSLRGVRQTPEALSTLPVSAPLEHLETGIVHLGIGAFARAHLLWATERALRQQGSKHWGVAGVSLRNPDTRDALGPQDGLYLVNLRGVDEQGSPHETLELISCLTRLLVAPENPQAVVDLLAAPTVRIVSLTITEKGYGLAPNGELNLTDPAIAHDLSGEPVPCSAIGYLIAGLARRHQAGLPGVTLLSCDNLPHNGQQLKQAVLGMSRVIAPELCDWIERECRFPCSMVDRIVPRMTHDDRARLRAKYGVQDAWPVVGEHFFDWVIEDDFVQGRPAWELAGARFVADAKPWETLKLRMVNGAHSAIAYLAQSAGWTTVDQAVAHPLMRAYLQRLWSSEIEPTLPPLPGLDLTDYRARLLQRFANPALQHQTRQIAMDGTQKIPIRWLATLADRPGQRSPCFALAMAAWLLHVLRSLSTPGHTLDDPQSEALQAIYDAAGIDLSTTTMTRTSMWRLHQQVIASGLLGTHASLCPAWLEAVDDAAGRLTEDLSAALNWATHLD